MKDSMRILCEHLRAGQAVVTATIVYQAGSTPRGAGSKLLYGSAGLLQGTIGGGLSEALTLQACAELLKSGPNTGRAQVLDFDLSGELAAQSDMICGGHVRVLLEAWYPEPAVLNFFAQVLQALKTQGGILLRPMPLPLNKAAQPTGGTLISLRQDTCVYGAPLPDAVLQVVQKRGKLLHATVVQVQGREYFLEPCVPPWQMIIAGGGHVSLSTAQIASLAGFTVHVIDDRAEFAAAERFPWAASTRHCPEFSHCFSDFSVHTNTCIVIVTRGHLHDGQVLQQALHSGAAYIGMIGSRRKRDALYAQLEQQGVTTAALAQVHCPIGLSIQAETPEEIAVSIVAECIAHKRKERT